MNYAVLRGMKQAAFMNVVGTVFKLVPILLFIVIMIVGFHWAYFTTDMLGNETVLADKLKPLGSMMTQVKSTMLVTLWAFIGIEGAVVVSGVPRTRAASAKPRFWGS